MRFYDYTGGAVETNGYILEDSGEVVVVDAPAGMADYVDSLGLKATRLLLTHQHFDHVEDAGELQRRGAELYGHSPFSEELTLEEGARAWGLPIEIEPFEVTHLVKEGERLGFGEIELEVLHVPGHSPDSLCYYQKKETRLMAGDTLFRRGIGRTDLPNHGNESLLLTGISQKILTLAEDTQIWPGHGSPTTSGEEKQLNPFLA